MKKGGEEGSDFGDCGTGAQLGIADKTGTIQADRTLRGKMQDMGFRQSERD